MTNGDINGDGIDDIIVWSASTANIVYFLGKSEMKAEVIDEYGNRGPSSWFHSPVPILNVGQIYGNPWKTLAPTFFEIGASLDLVDIDKDFDLDVVVSHSPRSNPSYQAMHVYLNLGSKAAKRFQPGHEDCDSQKSRQNLKYPMKNMAVIASTTGDIDGDGDPDIVSYAYNGDGTYIVSLDNKFYGYMKSV